MSQELGSQLRVSPDCNLGVNWDEFLSGGLIVEEFTSKLTQVVGRIHFLIVVRLRAPASCWSLFCGCPPLLDTSTVSCNLGSSCVAAYFIKSTWRVSWVSLPASTGTWDNITKLLEWYQVTIQRMGLYMAVNTRRWASWAHLRVCLPQWKPSLVPQRNI